MRDSDLTTMYLLHGNVPPRGNESYKHAAVRKFAPEHQANSSKTPIYIVYRAGIPVETPVPVVPKPYELLLPRAHKGSNKGTLLPRSDSSSHKARIALNYA